MFGHFECLTSFHYDHDSHVSEYYNKIYYMIDCQSMVPVLVILLEKDRCQVVVECNVDLFVIAKQMSVSSSDLFSCS